MIAEAVLLDVLEGVHSGRLRVGEAFRALRAADIPERVDRGDLIDHIRNTVWHESEALATADEVADGIIARLRPDVRVDSARGVLIDYLGGRPVHECMDELVTIFRTAS